MVGLTPKWVQIIGFISAAQHTYVVANATFEARRGVSP
jgi:hypothetical protein